MLHEQGLPATYYNNLNKKQGMSKKITIYPIKFAAKTKKKIILKAYLF